MLRKSIALGIITSLIERGDAELSFLDLKGIDALVDHPGASPLYGYVALKTFLPNRRFLGNYGVGDRGLCKDARGKLAKGLLMKNDCPLDANAELVQRLFPSPDGVNFVANQIHSDIVTLMKPETIGSVLNRLAQVTDDECADDGAMSALKTELADILFRKIHPIRFYGSRYTDLQTWAKRFSKKHKEAYRILTMEPLTYDEIARTVNKLIKSIDSDKFGEFLDELAGQLEGASRGLVDRTRRMIAREVQHEDEALEQIHERLDKVIQSNRRIEEERKQLESTLDGKILDNFDELRTIKHEMSLIDRDVQFGNRVEFEALASVIVDAVRESRGAVPIPNDVSYPKYMPEHALLAFFTQKAKSKKDLVSLFDGMPSLVKNKDWFHRTERDSLVERFANMRWSSRDIDERFVLGDSFLRTLEEKWDENFREEYMSWSAEKMMFHLISLEQGSSSYPHPLTYSEVYFESGDHYPDCGETSLRNFFNILLFDTKTSSFEMNLLDAAEEADPDVHFDEALRSFYRTFSSVYSAVSSQARQEWGTMVVPGREGVTYKHGWYEIQGLGDPDNMLALIGQLVFRDDESRSRRWDSKSRDEKLNTLCRILSTADRKISWEYEIMNPDVQSVKVAFFFDGEHAFSYLFALSNFVVTLHGTTKGFYDETWRGYLEGMIPGPQDPRKYLVPLTVDSYYFDKRGKLFANERSFRVNLLYSVPFTEVSALRLTFIKAVDLLGKGFYELKQVVKKIRSRIPENKDINIARTVEQALLQAEYPLGLPEHARNRPDAVYRLVPADEVIRRFGADVAHTIGRSFARRLFGISELLITEPVGTEVKYGGETYMRRLDLPQARAGEACIGLNPKRDQDRIRHEIEARDGALRALRDRMNSIGTMNCSPDGPIAEIYNEFPVSGFHLLSMEEFGCIFMDMGATNLVTRDGLIPQFLPDINYRQWTSSSFGRSAVSTQHQGGLSIDTQKNERLAFRCGIDLIAD